MTNQVAPYAHASGSTARDALRFLLKHVQRHWMMALGVLILGAVSVILQNVIAPLWYKKFVDAVTHASTLSNPEGALMVILAVTIGIRLFGYLFSNLKYRLNIRFQPKVMYELHEEAMRLMLRHSYRFYADTFAGSLTRKIGRLSNLFEDLADILMSQIWGILLSIGGILFILARQYGAVALVVVAWIIVYTVFQTSYVRLKLRFHREFSRLDAIAIGIMSDIFSNAITVKLFGRSKDEVKRFLLADEAAMGQMKRNWAATANMGLVTNALDAVLELVVLGMMIHGLVAQTLTVGDVVLLQSFLLVIFGQLSHIGRTIRRTLEITSQIQEVLDILHQEPEVTDMRSAKKFHITTGAIVLDDVSFKYHDTWIVQRLSINVAPKEKVAFVGPSGAGKTTLTKLLLRFFDIQKGKILIDGQDISKVTQESLRDAFGYVPQEPLLFHRTLRENIAYGRPDASLDEVMAAAQKAYCHEFIVSLPLGYETLVGERGIKLSGGERQRVAIARAILKDAPILVLDEATSSLDSESEALI